METSKPSWRIEISPALLAQLRSLEKSERRALGELMQQVLRDFGHPHMHAGTGLRRLAADVFECRYNLRQRIVFTVHKGYLYFHLLGNHNEVQRFLKNL